jgi:uncharacterized protein (DUF1800 family)
VLEQTSMNRRDFFTMRAPRNGTAAVAFLKNGATQTLPIVHARRSSTGLEAYTGPWDYAHAAHLLRRATIGPTEAEIRQAVTDGLAATIVKLFTSFAPPLDLISSWAGQDPQIRPASASQADVDAFQQTAFDHRMQLTKWWPKVMATAPLSIQERMTLFWHNHFTSEFDVVNFAEFMYTQNQLLRTNALGNFKKFVRDVTVDIAMLIYLDGGKNYKTGNRDNINENYARELQELFTMGVTDWDGNPNYTETDVHEAARSLSGWVGVPSSKGTLYAGLTSQFLSIRWDSDNKTFLGQTGKWNTDDVINIIFTQRADQVAKYICGKLYRAFVYDIPDRVVVAQMAETLRTNNWEIKPVMEQLLTSAHFYDETNIGAMEKSPIDYVVGLVRGMRLGNIPDFVPATGRVAIDLVNRLDVFGQLGFNPPNVKGWPGGRSWISTSTLPIRQKFTIDVSNGAIKGRGSDTTYYMFDPVVFAKTFPNPGEIDELAADMARYFLNVEPSAKESQILYDTLLDGGAPYEWKIDDPAQKPDVRIRKFLAALVQLAKFQLY